MDEHTQIQKQLNLLKDLKLDPSPLIVTEDLYDLESVQGHRIMMVDICFNGRRICTVKECLEKKFKGIQSLIERGEVSVIPKNLVFTKQQSYNYTLKYQTADNKYILIFSHNELDYLITSGALKIGA